MIKSLHVSQSEAASMATSVEPFCDDRGLLGFACARNMRKLADACLEYIKIRDSALKEFGEGVIDANDRVVGYRIGPESEGWARFKDRMEPFDGLECDVEIMTVPASEVIGKISGRESLTIDWMIEEVDGA